MCLKKEKILTTIILLQLISMIYSYEYQYTILNKNSYNFLDNFKLLNYNTFLQYITLILLLNIILFIKRDVNKLIESKLKIIEKMINNYEAKLDKLEKSFKLELKGIRYDINENNIENIIKEFKEIIVDINRIQSRRLCVDIRNQFENICNRVEKYDTILDSKINKLLKKFNIK